MRKIALVGITIGFVIAIASIVRWVFVFSDLSQALLGASIGFLIAILAYIYDKLIVVEQRLNAHTSIKFGMEKEDMEKIAKGEEIQ